MRVFVAGATGRVGRQLVDDLVRLGHEVIAASRHANEVKWPKNVAPCKLDFHESAEEMSKKLTGCDAIYFVAGSRGKDLLQTDAFGAVKLMAAAKMADVERFVMLSSIFSMQPDRWAEEPSLANITDYNIAKFFADEYLINASGLKWTIVQPSVLKEESATGKVEIDPDHDGSNPIPDVAAMLAGVLEHLNTIGKVIMMRAGTTPIDKALETV